MAIRHCAKYYEAEPEFELYWPDYSLPPSGPLLPESGDKGVCVSAEKDIVCDKVLFESGPEPEIPRLVLCGHTRAFMTTPVELPPSPQPAESDGQEQENCAVLSYLTFSLYQLAKSVDHSHRPALEPLLREAYRALNEVMLATERRKELRTAVLTMLPSLMLFVNPG